MNYRKQLTQDFNFDATVNLSTLKNEVLSLGDNVQPITSGGMSSFFNDAPSITMPGEAIGSFYGYKITEPRNWCAQHLRHCGALWRHLYVCGAEG